MSVTFNDRIRVGQIGTIITVNMTQIVSGADVSIDLTTCNLAQIDLRKPDNTIVTVNASILSPATAGLIRYTDSAGLFDIRGRWQIRGRVSFVGGNTFPGSWVGFNVEQ